VRTKQIAKLLQENLYKAQERMKKCSDLRLVDKEFQCGDLSNKVWQIHHSTSQLPDFMALLAGWRELARWLETSDACWHKNT